MNLHFIYGLRPILVIACTLLTGLTPKAHGADVYSKPILFPPDANEIHLTAPQIKWDISNGTRLNLGGLILPDSGIRMTLTSGDRKDYPWRLIRREMSDERKVHNLSFSWPNILVRVGRIQILNRSDKVLWAKEVDLQKRDAWAETLLDDKGTLLAAHKGSEFGETDINTKKLPFLRNGEPFRYCLSYSKDSERIRICSHFYRAEPSKDAFQITPVPQDQTPTVAIEGRKVGPRGLVNFPGVDPLEVMVFFKSGSTLTFKSKPIRIDLIDAVESKNGKRIYLTGEGPKPIGAVKYLYIPATHFWSATGQEEEKVWQMDISRNTPILRVIGAWNIPFAYLVRFNDLPKEQDRAYLRSHTTSGTYSESADLYGQHSMPGVLTSTEKRVRQTGTETFNWTFLAKDKGRANTARLLIPKSDGSGSWVGSHRLFRGYPIELSGRLTGIVAANLQTVFIGEVAAAKWFENIISSKNYYLSHQRWGLTARYFRALQAMALAADSEDSVSLSLSSFSVANVDLRYNLFPGLWNRDELFGFMISAEYIDLGGLNAPLAGVGAYWARTMPKVFDDVFNIFWLFRYPKYVDMEFTYYPMSLNSEVTPGVTYNLNFHGKVFWSERVYGEAGFGLKQFGYSNVSQNAEVGIATFYGTVGLGVIF